MRSQQAEGLTLLEADNKAGYFGVYLTKPDRSKPYQPGAGEARCGQRQRPRAGCEKNT